MYWNVDFVISSAAILVIVLFFYLRLHRLPIERYRAFSQLLRVCLLTLGTDLAASWVNHRFVHIPLAFLSIFNISYLFFICLRSYCFFCYMVAIVRGAVRLTGFVMWGPVIPLVAYAFLLVTEAVREGMFSTASGTFETGVVYDVMNLVCAFYAVFSIYIVWKGRSAESTVEYRCLILANILLLAGTYFHRLLTGILIQNFFVTATILMLFLSMQDPKFYINGELNAYNINGFRAVYREFGEKSEPVCTLGFVVIAYNDLKAMHGEGTIHGAMKEICAYVDSLHGKYSGDWTLYYLDNGDFVILGSKEALLKSLKMDLQKRFQRVWQTGGIDIVLEAHFFMMRDDVRPHDADEFIDTVHGLMSIAAHPASTLDENADELAVRHLRHERAVLHALDRAVRNNSIEVWFQPIYSIREKRVNGAEALSRLNDPQMGYIPPGEFIDIAERNGLIDKLGDQIIRKTCDFIKNYDMKALGIEYININLSPIQLTSGDINRHFTSIVNEYGIPHDFLKVEITEAASVDSAFLSEKMLELKNRGFHMALDDFGTGYSNLMRIMDYPFEVIKLDLTLVWSYFREDKGVLPGIISIFKAQNYTVVAEGVENEIMAQGLAKLGVDSLQGYYFSKALPPEKFIIYCHAGTAAAV